MLTLQTLQWGAQLATASGTLFALSPGKFSR
jgi:hypothetical protein